jgi:tetratricopeptide (TPR) repeat protein
MIVSSKKTIALAAAGLMMSTATALAKSPTKKPIVPAVKPVEIKTGDAAVKSSQQEAISFGSQTSSDKGNQKAWESFQSIRKKYRAGEIGDEGMWARITEIADEIKTMNRHQQAAVLQTQATLMQRADQPILSAVYAAQAIRDASNPIDDDYRKSWQILRDVSRERPIQNLIEIVATSINLPDKEAPGFGSDWNYFLANALFKQQKTAKALELYRRVKPGDRYYFPSKFQESMIMLESGKKLEAITALKSIVYPASGKGKKLANDEYLSMADHANMALGRIYYEERQFSDAIKHYRLVRRDSAQFYDALFEQSWALFLAGYPNHALGMIYGVRSPFFKDTFNPEATMLSSIIYYWMCRYDDSRQELASFMTNHQKSIDALDRYLARGITDANTYYRLFEDTVTGVSSESLGLPREVLVMATQQDNLLYVRDQYAAVVKEIQRLDAKGVFGSRERLEGPRSYLDQWAAVLREEIGLRLHRELKAMKLDYERLYDQGQFLYVELLMSKKDQLLGKELHSTGKIDKVSQTENIRGWGKATFSWASDDKQEYWADELGFHIYRIEPLCVASK